MHFPAKNAHPLNLGLFFLKVEKDRGFESNGPAKTFEFGIKES